MPVLRGGKFIQEKWRNVSLAPTKFYSLAAEYNVNLL